MKPDRAITRKHTSLFWAVALVLVSFSLFPTQSHGQTDGTPDSSSAWVQSIIDALKDWLANQESGDESDGEASDAPDPDPNPDDSSAPAPDSIAKTIANDAGGHPDQYTNYSERLSETLAKLTPAQRVRVFGS